MSEKMVPNNLDDLVDLEPVPLTSEFSKPVEEIRDENMDLNEADVPMQEEIHDDAPQSPHLLENPHINVRRFTRDRKASTRYSSNDYVLLTDIGEPDSYEEAMEDEHKEEWVDAMQDEMHSLHENHTFELVKLPKGKRALKNRWVYRVKQEEHTACPRYKARLVVKGFTQKKGVDFDEIFAPVVKMTSVRVILGLVATLDLEVEQMYVKIVFFTVV